MSLIINVVGTPAPQGSKRGMVHRHSGRVVMVESSAKVKPWREAVKYAALDVLRDEDAERHGLPVSAGPVALRVTFYLPRPKGHYRTGRNALRLRDAAPAFPAGKPDIDKLLRSTLDALGEAGCWRDDAQVVSVYGSKVYAGSQATGSDQPGASIRVGPVA